MFKLEFPAENKALAGYLGRALVGYSESTQELSAGVTTTHTTTTTAGDHSITEVVKTEPTSHEIMEEYNEQHVAGPDTDTRVDLHGTRFDGEFCANASDPFYKTGKTSGQWKKKKGVSEEEYNTWYASVKPTTTGPAETGIDTTEAFSGGQQVTAPKAPANGGEFIVWVSEMTTAGHFTQADVTQAYTDGGVGPADIFAGDSASAANIATLHGILSARVPA